MSKFVVLEVLKEHGDVVEMIIDRNRIISLDFKGWAFNNTIMSWWLKYETEERGQRTCVIAGTKEHLLNLLNGADVYAG